MAIFRRKKKESVLPEVDKYYEGERRDRTGVAWLLAIVSIIIVALIIVAVFLAGRWVWRETFGDDNQETTTTSNEGGQNVPSIDGGAEDQQSNDGEQGENGESQDGASDGSEDGDGQEGGETGQRDDSTEGSVDAPATTDIPSDSTAQVPATGDNSLPGTGPANVLGAFIASSSLFGGAHYIYNRRSKLKR